MRSISSLSLDKQALYDRFNLLRKFKIFCQDCTCSFFFWLAVAFFTFVEPVLCGFYPTGEILLAQVAVLTVSSLLYVIQLVGVATREWDKIMVIEAMSSLSTMSISHNVKNFTALKMFIFFSAEGEYILEFWCLFGGWIMIFWHPGIAVLRCFRMFRLLWFYEVDVFKSTVDYTLSPILGKQSVSNMFNVLKFAIGALTALGSEMFKLTTKTRGALLLIMLFFYSAFVLGTSLWIETNGADPNCTSMGTCSFTLMRLTFFDGNGFDFAYSLTENNRIMFCLVMLYMCITAFGILNGLVGIFGTVISTASEEAFNNDDDDGDNYAKQISSPSEDDDDDDSDVEDNNDNKDGNPESPVGEEGVFAAVPRRNAVQAMTADGSQPHQSAASREKELAVKRKLMEEIGGKSNFAMRELAKLSEAPVKQETTAAAKPRSLRNFVKKALSTGNGSPIVPNNNQLPSPDDDNNSIASSVVKGQNIEQNQDTVNNSSPGQQPPQLLLQGRFKPKVITSSPDKQPPPRQFHAAAGMFATMKKQKSSKFTNDNNGSSSGNNIINNIEVKLVNTNMLSLQRKIDAENEMLSSLFSQVQHLTTQLQTNYPELQQQQQQLQINHNYSSNNSSTSNVNNYNQVHSI